MFGIRRLAGGLALAIVVFASARCSRAESLESDYAAAMATYDQARRTNRSADWHKAIGELGRFVDEHPQHRRAPEASLFLAEALHSAGQSQQACQQYRAFLSAYAHLVPHYEAVARFRIGEIAFLADDSAAAKTALDDFVERFSGDRLVANALSYLGKIALRQGDGSAAAEYFDRLIRHFPPHADLPADQRKLRDEAVFYKARAEQRQGDVDSARKLYGQLYGDPQGALALQAMYDAARLEYQAGRHAESARLLTSLISSCPEGPMATSARYLLGLTQIAQGQYDSAARTLRAITVPDAEEPLAPSVAHHLAEALRLSGAVDQATAQYQRVVQTWRESEWADDSAYALIESAAQRGDSETVLQLHEQLSSLLAKSPRRRQARHLVVRALIARKRFADALKVLDDLADTETSPPGGPPVPDAESDLLPDAESDLRGLALYRWAEEDQALGRHEEAHARLEQLHQEMPDSRYGGLATYRLAEAAACNKQIDQAMVLLEQLAEANVDDEIASRALYLRGQVAAEAEKWPVVIASMSEFVSAYPEDALRAPAEYWIAEALYRQKKYGESQQRLQSLEHTTRDRQQPWHGMIMLRQAQILAHQDRWLDAHEMASGISHQFPEFEQQYEVDYLLGRCLARQGRFREARDAYQRVLTSPEGRKSETAAMAQWMIGETYFHQQQYQRAIPAYLRVELLYPYPHWRAGGLLQAGKCYEIQHDYGAAIELYARLLKQYPDTSFRDEASRRMREARRQRQATIAS